MGPNLKDIFKGGDDDKFKLQNALNSFDAVNEYLEEEENAQIKSQFNEITDLEWEDDKGAMTDAINDWLDDAGEDKIKELRELFDKHLPQDDE